MGRRTSKDPFYPDHLASDTEAEDYDPANGPACGIFDFRPDLAGTAGNPWNASVVQLFVAHFMDKEPDADIDEVTDLFEGHLKYLCLRYKESLQGEKAARRRQSLANRAERQRNVMQLWLRRLTVAAFHPDLQIHIPILRSLGPFGMSSDESDHNSGEGIRYRILRKPWRNPELANWLQFFDKLYSIWRLGNMTGAQPHPRVPSNAISIRRPPVRGLPWNAYNEAWFKKLTDYDKILLSPKMDEKYQFSHPPSLRAQT
ncbi:hypothetical protein L227DRAFT_500317 [Lentinus tigrinus ALCF2SS1-6]|uniref:Uncharacterized protein n=1 Tax=Lentinus tigrinus ALCF2SS1-6 TaxID=1328759 RepID=A0A5C2SCJ6_9APHY|nr:hypothetical protein L227DRAFT_500317 [Lentinus tigrinus ALCF2SS1-6]